MSKKRDYAAYISDLVYFFRDACTLAKREAESDTKNAEYNHGRAMAYVEILSFMQNQADTFLIPRGDIGLEGFDPIDLLGREKPEP